MVFTTTSLKSITSKTLSSKGEFLEYAEVFGNYYGTSRVWIEENLERGIDVFLDIDWQGARQIREQMPQAKSVCIHSATIKW